MLGIIFFNIIFHSLSVRIIKSCAGLVATTNVYIKAFRCVEEKVMESHENGDPLGKRLRNPRFLCYLNTAINTIATNR